jgi:hypothetical protein
MREPTDALVDRVRELYLRPEEEWRRTAILEGITQLTADLARLREEREALNFTVARLKDALAAYTDADHDGTAG